VEGESGGGDFLDLPFTGTAVLGEVDIVEIRARPVR
jgi:hypothetical protein